MRAGIGLRSYGQREPLVEYKRESHNLYRDLLATIRNSIVYTIFKTELHTQGQPAPVKQTRELGPAKTSDEQAAMAAPKPRDASGHKVGRNDPCPCGSGKKYKKCHGK